jgi:hypothetical protein
VQPVAARPLSDSYCLVQYALGDERGLTPLSHVPIEMQIVFTIGTRNFEILHSLDLSPTCVAAINAMHLLYTAGPVGK